MYPHSFGKREAVRCLTGLDLGLRVRIHAYSSQRSFFSGPDRHAARDLASELAEHVSSLRVYRYGIRVQLEEVTTALLNNIACGTWSYARRAALDLAGILGYAQRRRLISGDGGQRAREIARRIADLCAQKVR